MIEKSNLENREDWYRLVNGVWLSLVRALDLGSRGRPFESGHPNFYFYKLIRKGDVRIENLNLYIKWAIAKLKKGDKLWLIITKIHYW